MSKNQSTPKHYTEYMAAYSDMHRRVTGMPIRIQAQDGAALKRIIAYLDEGAEGDTEAALVLWKALMGAWENLNPFLREQVRLTQIDKYLTEIILKLKKYAEQRTEQKADAALAALLDRRG